MENIITEEEKMKIQEDMHYFVSDVSNLINKHESLKTKNFALYYQHGRLGYVDLDAFAESIKADELFKKEKDKKELDKKEQE